MLSVEEFGWYAVGLAIRLLFLVPLDSLVLTPLTVLNGRSENGATRKQREGSIIAMFQITATVIVVAGFIGGVIFRLPGLEFAMFILAGVAIDFQRKLNFMDDRPYQDFIGGSINLLGVSVLLLLLARFHLLSLATAFLAIGSVGVLWAAGSGWSRWKQWRTSITWHEIRALWRIGRWGLASNSAGYVFSQVSLFMTLQIIGPVGVAVLELARQAVSFVQVLLAGMANLWGPRLARSAAHDTRQQFMRFIWQVTGLQTVVGVTLLASVLFSLDYLLPVLFPNKTEIYGATISVAWILAGAMVCQLLSQHPSFGVVALGKPEYGFVTRLVSCVLLVPIGYGLTLAYGVPGAAWTRLIGEVVVLVLSIIMLQRAARSPAMEIMETGSLAR